MKIGLVLEGGGVKGAFEIGALKAIYEEGAAFGAVAGASIGAVNGAFIAQAGVDFALDFWQNMKPDMLYELTPEIEKLLEQNEVKPLETFRTIVRSYGSAREFFRRSAFKARSNFRRIFDEDAIRRSDMDFGLTVVDVSDMKAEEIMKDEIPIGKLVDYIMASATYPVFPPYPIDGKKYIDGGVYDNMPVNLLARHGYDKILVIRTNTMDKRPKRKQERKDIDVYVLAPGEDLGNGMLFSNPKQLKYLDMGYAAATAALEKDMKKFLLEE